MWLLFKISRMQAYPFRVLRIFYLVVLCISFYPATASHVVGGEVSYLFLGPAPGGNKYQISLSIYEDCLTGNPVSIAADDPAFCTIYDGNDSLIYHDSVFHVSSITVPSNFSNGCIANAPLVCLYKKTFVYNFVLAPNATGYTFAYQRCCRNGGILNIEEPGNVGATYYCTIPPASLAANNNSAVFANYPPQIICVNDPLLYNNSATDPDGDSLTYELCRAYSSPNGLQQSEPATPPPFTDAVYVNPPFSYSMPMTAYPALQVDAKTGLISGTPNRVGRYVVDVCCHEWRNGVMINTIQREFQFLVTDCSKNVVANIPLLTTYPNTFELNCKNHTVHFINTSTGGVTWLWDFGVPGAPKDTSFEPTFVYPDTGTYAMKLVVNPGGTCQDSIVRLVRVYPTFKAQFSNEGDQCTGLPVTFTDQTVATAKPITNWQWYFGDGDSAVTENTAHTYVNAGTYDAMLISQNVTQCVDTIVKQVVIDNFKPFAGNDTIIVKGESIQFNATGGTGYTWIPAANLSNTTIYNPVGYYSDTGLYTYYVQVQSEYGCTGYDTINVTVVNQAAFFVPTAFTPNGDRRNDLFRPVAVGYRDLVYFMVYNRFGQQVYYSTTLDAGWNGTFNNKVADVGTYFWQIRYTDRFGKEGYLKGDVTLIR